MTVRPHATAAQMPARTVSARATTPSTQPAPTSTLLVSTRSPASTSTAGAVGRAAPPVDLDEQLPRRPAPRRPRVGEAELGDGAPHERPADRQVRERHDQGHEHARRTRPRTTAAAPPPRGRSGTSPRRRRGRPAPGARRSAGRAAGRRRPRARRPGRRRRPPPRAGRASGGTAARRGPARGGTRRRPRRSGTRRPSVVPRHGWRGRGRARCGRRGTRFPLRLSSVTNRRRSATSPATSM